MLGFKLLSTPEWFIVFLLISMLEFIDVFGLHCLFWCMHVSLSLGFTPMVLRGSVFVPVPVFILVLMLPLVTWHS